MSIWSPEWAPSNRPKKQCRNWKWHNFSFQSKSFLVLFVMFQMNSTCTNWIVVQLLTQSLFWIKWILIFVVFARFKLVYWKLRLEVAIFVYYLPFDSVFRQFDRLLSGVDWIVSWRFIGKIDFHEVLIVSFGMDFVFVWIAQTNRRIVLEGRHRADWNEIGFDFGSQGFDDVQLVNAEKSGDLHQRPWPLNSDFLLKYVLLFTGKMTIFKNDSYVFRFILKIN